MYSSISLALVGDNNLKENLRLLTAIELFLNADFYSQHPYFSSVFNTHGVKITHYLNNILPMCVSCEALDSNLRGVELVRQEAILISVDKVWSSFLCILALASVTKTNIQSLYPDSGEKKYRLLLNARVEPRPPVKSVADVYVLFCYHGSVQSGVTFEPNHFVPIVFSTKPISGLKRKLATIPLDRTKQTKIKFTPISFSSSSSLVQSVVPNVGVSASLSTTLASTFTSVVSSSSIVKQVTSTSKVGIGESETPVRFDHDYDIAGYRGKANGKTDSEIGVLIKNVFVPGEGFSFPSTGGRSFRLDWLRLYPWLCYSPSQDGAYCLPCTFF